MFEYMTSRFARVPQRRMAEPEEIAAGMRQLADDLDLRRDLAARGLQRAAQFTWQRTAELTLQVYRELLP